MRTTRKAMVGSGLLVFYLLLGRASISHAQVPADEERDIGWSNTTDLSLVLTEGNSAARTLGFANRLERVWPTARARFDINGVRSGTSDDRFYLVDPGFRFSPGQTPAGLTSTLVKPQPSQNVANYLIGGRYDQNISEHFFWNTGASWDRNEDAGILHRYAAFGGVGHVWRDSDDFKFSTTYGISYTDRKEEQPDPDKDRRFAGARLAWDYLHGLGPVTVFESDFTTNINLAEASDYSFTTVNAVSVIMSNNLSLKVSLQWLFENDPALVDADVLARVNVIDPDRIPGSGDELFETVETDGAEIVLGKTRARKDKLDTAFRTALVISF